MDYTDILEKLVLGDLLEYQIDPQKDPEDAFAFQQSLRNYGKNKKIPGRAGRGGVITYTSIENKPKY